MKKTENTSYFASYFIDASKKDLVNLVPTLKKSLNTIGLEKTREKFTNYLDKKIYHRYTKHLNGVAHHNGLGPSRRPLKIYKYLVNLLKGLRGTFKDIEEVNKSYTIKKILINSSGYKKTGFIRSSRGQAALKKTKYHKLVFFWE